MSDLGGRAYSWTLVLVIGALAGCIGDDAAEEEHDHRDHDHGLEPEGMDHVPALAPTLGFDATLASTAAGNGTHEGQGSNATGGEAAGNGTEGDNATAKAGLVTFYADVLMCTPEHGDDTDDGADDASSNDTAENGTDATAGNTTDDGNATHDDVGQQAVFADGAFSCPAGREPGDQEAASADQASDGDTNAGAGADNRTAADSEGNTTTGNATTGHAAGPFSFVLAFGDGNETSGTEADFPFAIDHTFDPGNYTAILEITFDDRAPLVGALDLRIEAVQNATDAAGPAFEPIFVVLQMVDGCELCVDGDNPATGTPGAQGCIGFQLGENELDCGWVEIPQEAWGAPFSVRSELNGPLVGVLGTEGSPDLEFYDSCSASGTEIYEDIDGNHDSDMAEGIIPEGAGCLIVFDFHWPNLGYFVEFSIGAATH